jgi:VIT1/CCC1 family predicted Fe2+/Mn2+ transporter
MSSPDDLTRRRRVLDPVERVSEVTFGVLMALSFTGALSVATAGREEVRTMMLTALGCNLAWGLTDAVMYLVGTVVEQSREVALLRTVADDEGNAEETHRRIAAPMRRSLAGADYAAALEVFVLVVLATFPVVIPFVFLQDAAIALRISNLLSIVTLFACGYALGRYAQSNAWRFGLAMAAIGTVLVAAIVALGG